jgi:hypothetical protein
MPKQIGPIPIRGDSDLNWDPSIGYWLVIIFYPSYRCEVEADWKYM